MTYKALNEKSNQLARYIRSEYKNRTGKDLLPDTLIALCLDRSLEMIIGILGVLKAGGAYVPMDPSYPQERIDYMLGDTCTELIISQRQLGEDAQTKLPLDKVLYIDLSESFYKEEDNKNLDRYSKPEDLAYIIYTSGTTGKPKGVMVEHTAVSNTLNALSGVYNNKEISKVTAYTSYVFDVSVSEIFSSLSQGLELHILANTVRTDSIALSSYFKTHKINLVYLPPVLITSRY